MNISHGDNDALSGVCNEALTGKLSLKMQRGNKMKATSLLSRFAGSLALATVTATVALAQSTSAPAPAGSTAATPPAAPAPANPANAAPAPSGKKLACQSASQAMKGQARQDQMQLCMMQARLDCLKQAIDQNIVGPQRKDFVKSCVG